MVRYLIGRLLAILAVVFGVTVLTFLIAQVVPADPAVNLAGEYATAETVEEIRQAEGLDEPLPVQYGRYVGRLAQGDLGTSMFTKQPVADELPARLGATVDLATTAMVIAVLIGVSTGVAAAVRRNSWIDHLARALAVVGTAMPVFWLGLLLVRIFYTNLHLLPAVGRYEAGVPPPPAVTQSLIVDSVLAGNWQMLSSALAHVALPALTLGIMGAGLISRVMRASMLEALGREFVVTARAKGMSERRIVYVHTLRNAMLPTLTVMGVTYGALLGGAVLTEKIFSWPGLGLYAVNAMEHLDFAPVMGVVIVITLAYVVANLIVDLAYGLFDPRVRSARS